MRIHEYRAWDEVLKEMRYQKSMNIRAGDVLNRFSIPLEYIGKKDKQGKKIHEGDWLYKDGKTYEVRWSDFNAGFGLAQNESNWPKQDDGYAYCSGIEQSEEYEISGNIYENPEGL